MSDDPTNQYDIYTGAWTNWSKASAFRSTLTLGRREANLLIAFVAFFVATVGARFWRIACLIMHYSHSSHEAQDGLYYQRQAILRNTANAESGMFHVFELAWAWRKAARRSALRLLPLMIFSVCCVFGFITAGGFSSSISVAMGNEVLLASTKCNVLYRRVLFSATAEDLGKNYFPYVAKQISNAANYAQQCYSTNSSRFLGCGTFPTMRLPTIVHTNASCPFERSLCKSQDANLLLDTGILDSHEHFGINAPPNERLQFRRLLHCAPIVTEGYTSQFNLTADRSFTRYHYGSYFDVKRTLNYTYGYANIDPNEFNATLGWTPPPDYSLGIRQALYYGGKLATQTSNFEPIPGLLSEDADIYLFFLSAGKIRFSSKVEDPWYRATHPSSPFSYSTSEDTRQTTVSSYGQDEPASPLACKVQAQYCNPNLPKESQCTRLTSDNDSVRVSNATIYGGSKEWYRRMVWINSGIFGSISIIPELVASLGSRSLVSRYGLGIAGLQGPLPDNQWMLDVQNWHSISLAAMQASLVSTVTGQSDPNVDHFWSLPPNSTEERAVCENQKILSTAYVSFSIFGISFIAVVGGLIILISYALDPIFAWLRKRHNYRTYQQLEWCTNETLQLQRLAFEELGVGTWSQAAESIPITLMGEKLVALDLSDPEHPRMAAAPGQPRREEKHTVQEYVLEVQTSNDEPISIDVPNSEQQQTPRIGSHEVDLTPTTTTAAESELSSPSTTNSPNPQDIPVDSGRFDGPPSPELHRRQSGAEQGTDPPGT